jgi:2-polyprenyl-3-methyl-5-hydroxy-6-metoxy-1,4-benzoquinol methylase
MAEIMQDNSRWDAQYQSGRWDYLAGSEEFIRYAVINSFLLRQNGPLSLLDVGCGEGLLLKNLGPQFVSKYTGLDLAQAALDKINTKRSGDQYIRTSIEDFVPAEKWDAIVFNEVLYYTADPVAQIRKFENALTHAGVMIVSIHKKPRFWAYSNRCARRVRNYFSEAGYRIMDAVEIRKVFQGRRWEIYAVKPPSRTPVSQP